MRTPSRSVIHTAGSLRQPPPPRPAAPPHPHLHAEHDQLPDTSRRTCSPAVRATDAASTVTSSSFAAART
eukprot:6922461-Prymnesium_polylepis.1